MVKLSGLYTLAFVILMDLVASATGAFLVVVFPEPRYPRYHGARAAITSLIEPHMSGTRLT